MVKSAIASRDRLFPDANGRELLEHERLAVWAALPTPDWASNTTAVSIAYTVVLVSEMDCHTPLS